MNYFDIINKLVIYKGIQPNVFDAMPFYELEYLVEEWKNYIEQKKKEQEEYDRKVNSGQQSYNQPKLKQPKMPKMPKL
jgi:hypothetical protein